MQQDEQNQLLHKTIANKASLRVHGYQKDHHQAHNRMARRECSVRLQSSLHASMVRRYIRDCYREKSNGK